MNRRARWRRSENQAAWVGPVSWVILNDFPLEYREEDVLQCYSVGGRLLIGVIGNSKATSLNRVNDVVDAH